MQGSRSWFAHGPEVTKETFQKKKTFLKLSTQFFIFKAILSTRRLHFFTIRLKLLRQKKELLLLIVGVWQNKMLLKKNLFRSICFYRQVGWSFGDFAEIGSKENLWKLKNIVNPQTDNMNKQKIILTSPPKFFPSFSKNDDEKRKNVEKKLVVRKKCLWTRRVQFCQPLWNLSTQSQKLLAKTSETEKKKVQMICLSSKKPKENIGCRLYKSTKIFLTKRVMIFDQFPRIQKI